MSPDDLKPCPRCGLPPREGLTHASMWNDVKDPHEPRAPYVCVTCSLVELEEYRRTSRVLPYRDWACNDAVSRRSILG